MIIYWMGCVASMGIALLGQRCMSLKMGRGIIAAFSALPLVIIAAFRYDVGEDYLYTYLPYYETIRTIGNTGSYQMESLYHLLNVILAAFHADGVWIFIISALIFFFTVYANIFDESPDPAFSIFLLIGMNYYFVFFNAMRQMIGCGLLLFSIRYVRQKRFLPFVLCVAAATGFHKSCALFLSVYWLGRVKIKPIAAWAAVGLSALFANPIAALLRQLIEVTPYGIYFSSVFDTGETAYITLMINAVLLAFASWRYQRNENYQLYFNLQIVALLVAIFSGRIVLILRLLWMFGLPSVTLIPMAVQTLVSKKDRGTTKAVIVMAYFLYTMYTVEIQNSNSVLPYQTVFTRWFA